MARFDMTDWCDLVRGVADPDAEQEMRERLASGDAGAERLVEVLSRVAAVARTDEEAAPPEYAVRLAKAIGTVARPGGVADRSEVLRFLPFEVSFDSLRSPALAGTRDMRMSFRQLSFKAAAYTVDVRWDQDADPRTTVLVGQVLERSPEGRGAPRPLARIPVLVSSEGKIVGRSVTSDLGEFEAAGLPDDDLELFVLVGSESCIRLPLEQEAAD